MTERHFNLSRLRAVILPVLCGVVLQAGYVEICPIHALAHEDKKLAGGELFAGSGCAHCHGADGKGTDSGPSLRDVRKRLKPNQIAEQIQHGGKEMPAFGDILDDGKISDLVAFLDAKRWTMAPSLAPAAPSALPAK